MKLWIMGSAAVTIRRSCRRFDTRVFERPQAGRMWFEGVIRDHLDIGRPHQIALVFNRLVTRKTPGTFRTRVLTKGVDPTLCCYYKSSRLKQYFKEGKALRTETVICDTNDFGIGRRVCSENWNALKECGGVARSSYPRGGWCGHRSRRRAGDHQATTPRCRSNRNALKECAAV